MIPGSRAHLVSVIPALLLLLTHAREARAQEEAPRPDSPFPVVWAAAAPVTAAAFAVALVPEIPSIKARLGPPSCGLACNRANVDVFDRWVIGNHSAAADRVSTAFLAANIAGPVVFDLIDVAATRPPDGWPGFGRDTMVLAEVLAVDMAFNEVFKIAVHRPRPLAYDPADFAPSDRLAPDASLSFYSEHSSISFSMATAYGYLFTLRHPRSPFVPFVWAYAEGMATATAALRLAAGKHFLTDVLTGAGAGVAFGVLVPWLHRKVGVRAPSAIGAHLRVLPLAVPGGGGAMLALE